MSHTEVLTTAVVSQKPADKPVPPLGHNTIAGYHLQDRIGVGGYGEVWRAIGPGGFPKAVKILFGQVNGPQAESELKSLNLMRELRHPFLLNVERVELIDGRMVVVTELADCSLDQRYNEIVAAGGRGIPRGDLLGYLRDAADALDFMSEHHGLQHLDIKPENLLLQGSHAKVGDFGLTKSVAMSRASLVSGFTPLYAPPELFEGRATRNSDQYSLAIVYQTMLTGIPPFNGRNAAQLTAQHLHSNPDLSPLSNGDRSVVARALSKNADGRFSGCREFIDELARRRSGSGTSGRVNSGPAPEHIGSLTRVVDPAKLGKSQSTPARPAQPLPPLPLNGTPTRHRPTLFVAVGGLGMEILHSLHVKVQQQFPAKALPSIAFLVMDTDQESIRRLESTASAHSKIRFDELAIPLRSTQQYRKAANEHLGWLSRRWLFNIPRSGNVEGMRPLGRLAWVDNQRRIQEKLTQLFSTILSEKNISLTSEETGLDFDADAFDICIVGSTAGGTSSGIMLDVAFQLRRLLQSNAVRQKTRISAMLVHATSAGGRQTDAQDANSVCFLKELQHFGLPGAELPPDIRCQGQQLQRPFDAAWFVHLGDDLTTADYERHADQLSEYLRLWSVTSSRQVLEAWHREDENEASAATSEITLRTLGYAAVDIDSWKDASADAESLAMQVIRKWLSPVTGAASNGSSNSGMAEIAQDAGAELEKLFESLSLTNMQILEFMPGLLRGDTGKRIEIYAAEVWNRLQQKGASGGDLANLANTLAELVSDDAASGSQSQDSVARITQTIRQGLISRLQQSYKRVNIHMANVLDQRFRLGRATYTLAACVSRVEAAIAACSSQKADVQQSFSELCNSFMRSIEDNSTNSQVAPRNFCQQYCMLMTCQTVCQCVISHLTTLKDHLEKQQKELLPGVRNRLLTLTGGLAMNEVSGSPALAAMVDGFDQFLLESGQFRISALTKSDQSSAHSLALLVSDATNFLLKQNDNTVDAEMNSQKTIRSGKSNGGFPAVARPVLSNSGGYQRVLAIVPKAASSTTWKNRIQAEFGNCVHIEAAAQNAVSAFCEIKGIVIPVVIEELTHFRPRVAGLAERLHTRKDISW